MRNDTLFSSSYVVSHMSDLLRFLRWVGGDYSEWIAVSYMSDKSIHSLYKYQGTYLDMDVVVMRNLENYTNFAAAESNVIVAAGIINLDKTERVGRRFSKLFLRYTNTIFNSLLSSTFITYVFIIHSEFEKNFSTKCWGANGPGVLTRVLSRLCQTQRTLLMTKQRCEEFDVMSMKMAYAIAYPHWKHFFEPYFSRSVLKAIRGSIIAHFWNKISCRARVQVGGGSAYDLLAKRNCPKVYKSFGDHF